VLNNVDCTPFGSHRVHPSCRKKFTDLRQINKLTTLSAKAERDIVKKSLRSSSQGFNWMECCYLCGKELTDKLHVRKVMDINMHHGVKMQCQLRGDAWGLAVQGRLNMCNDLVAADALYHKNCLTRFRQGLQKSPHKSRRGRPSSTMGQRCV